MTTDTAPATAKKTQAAKKSAGSTPGGATGRGAGRPSNADKLRESLTVTYVTVGVIATPLLGKAAGLTPEQVEVAAATYVALAPQCAEAWVQLAETNPGVKQALEKMTQGSGWATVITAHATLAIGVVSAIKAAAPLDVADELPFDKGSPERVAPEG